MRPRLAHPAALALVLALGGCAVASDGHRYPWGEVEVSVDAAGCHEPAERPAGLSDAGIAYLDAVDAASEGWRQVDANIRATGVTHQDDLPIQTAADATFVAALREIAWPDEARATAEKLVAIVEAYDAVLTTAYDRIEYLTEHQDEVARLDETRAETSHALRGILGLPSSTCVYWRP